MTLNGNFDANDDGAADKVEVHAAPPAEQQPRRRGRPRRNFPAPMRTHPALADPDKVFAELFRDPIVAKARNILIFEDYSTRGLRSLAEAAGKEILTAGDGMLRQVPWRREPGEIVIHADIVVSACSFFTKDGWLYTMFEENAKCYEYLHDTGYADRKTYLVGLASACLENRSEAGAKPLYHAHTVITEAGAMARRDPPGKILQILMGPKWRE